MPISTTSYIHRAIYKTVKEINNNPLRAADINNNLVINAVDVARDNLKIP